MNGFCNIFIYKNCKILKNKNFKVDSIDDYLAGLDTLNEINTTTELPDPIQGQWMKHSLKLKYNIVIPINATAPLDRAQAGLGQHYLTFLDEYNYNYLTAQNIDTYKVGTGPWRTRVSSKVYYFIVGKKWLSESSIELELEMDVINTLLDNGGGGYYRLELSDKTTILREHKDRIKPVGVQNLYLPIIDRYSENIFVPLHKTAESGLVQKTNLPAPFNVVNLNFFLIYKSRQNPETDPESPIDILLCADEPVYIKGNSLGYTGSRNPKKELATSWEAWFVYGGDSSNIGTKISFTAKDGEHTIEISSSTTCVYISKSEIRVMTLRANPYPDVVARYKPGGLKKFTNVFFENVFYVRKGTNDPVEITLSNITNIPQDTSFPTTINANTRIGTIYDIDRTDPKLLKILKLPYCPIKATNWNIVRESEDGDDYFGFSLPAGWRILSGTPNFITYETSNVVDCFKNENIPVVNENNDLYSPFEVLKEMTINNLVGNITPKTTLNLEPKLYHSDYYIRKFVYDSFSYTFKMENYNKPSGLGEYVFLTFMVSSTMTSKMAFRFSNCDFIGSSNVNERGLKFDEQDYSNLVYVARNNELPLFNSAYLQYIRTGFNYDVKTKNRQLASNIVGGVLSTTGAIVSAVAGGPVGVAGAVALGIGAVSKFTSAIIQNAQSEQNIEQKLKSTEMQGLSVIGSDDVDIMSEYTENNKAKDITYEVSPKIKKCLFDLFYYCGYIANYQGIPNTTSRMWFNFVQADPVYKYEQNFPQEFIEELTKKFKEGITFLHKHSFRWDFEQQYENWETSLLPSNS